MRLHILRLHIALTHTPQTQEEKTAQHKEQNAALAEIRKMQEELRQERVRQLIDVSGLTQAGKEAVQLAAAGHDTGFVAQLIEAQRKVDAAAADRQIVRGIRPIMDSDDHNTHGPRAGIARLDLRCAGSRNPRPVYALNPGSCIRPSPET